MHLAQGENAKRLTGRSPDLDHEAAAGLEVRRVVALRDGPGEQVLGHPDRFSFPCFLAWISPRRKTQIPSGTETAPISSRGQMSPHTVPSPAPFRIALRMPRRA